ncbi:LysM domain/M23/M37 peptidase [Pseudooceanicola batsensis HTCC2597]|uniref:LysM domain/M23/M37 peptidase n=1 Tax=Pseudooceanicola batsensis (strain ATCC BAA-863 / DSM 15984 / KCTC 12145 / HTCC2597) TaxID=252305 RepID=A3U1Q7_PSEBH|nr:M23 family metallopeptidase [Pseudooceanicola batsensis]EAQ01841.1 LysM domain/M23/M37 peptidase [Pseudooceanicola batsensis HTCC2597]
MQQTATTTGTRTWVPRTLLAGTAILALSACDPVDMDLRGGLGGFSTTEAARVATIDRPRPDDRGIISYPNYQVVVSRRDDSVADVAARIGVDAQTLAEYNGLRVDDRLRNGEILALPGRVTEPSPATGAPGTGPFLPPGQVDITAMAGAAIDRAGDQSIDVATLPPAEDQLTAPEPVRHRVARGETAFTISRLYNVSVRSLADWNGLDSDFTIREGQYLLIPVAVDDAAPPPVTTEETVPPGTGTPTPVPPSASQPLPEERTEPITPAETAERTDTAGAEPATAAPDLSDQQTAAPSAAMDYPVKGRIIREYARGRSDGIDIAADPGTAVRAADAGTVAAITSDADNVRVIVVRHAGKLLTIYSNVDGIAVQEGQTVARGQKIAEIRSGESPYVHFEVRKGLEATDPMDYLQ